MHRLNRPVRLADVAVAAGCSLSALQAAFRRFRDTTALGALRDIRLRCAREALLRANDDEPTRTIARRLGSPIRRALLLHMVGVSANTQVRRDEKANSHSRLSLPWRERACPRTLDPSLLWAATKGVDLSCCHSKHCANCSRLNSAPLSLSSTRKPGGRFVNARVTFVPSVS